MTMGVDNDRRRFLALTGAGIGGAAAGWPGGASAGSSRSTSARARA
jgi:hypothetical protein